jgi:HSP20 family protein
MMPTTRLYLSPWRDLDTLTQRLADFYAADGWNGSRPAGGWNPAMSVEETPDALLLTAELPGMSPENVELHVENNVLTVRGEKRDAPAIEGEERSYHVRERSYGSFARSFTLPRSVRPDGITAGLENGLLRVRLPKAPEARSRRIEIAGKVPAAVAGDETTK